MFNLRFLNNLKQKLTTGNRGSIYLNALPERYLSRLDLEDFNTLRPHAAKDFLDTLWSKRAFRFPLSTNTTTDDSEKAALNTIFRRLSVLTIENNDHFTEQGVKTFGFGFPILLYRDQKDPNRIIKAPLFVWYLDIERNFKRANEWLITRQEEFPIIHNLVLAAFLHQNAAVQLTPVDEQLLDDAILDQEEIIQLVYTQLSQLYPNHTQNLKQDFRAALKAPIQALPSRQQIEQLPLTQAKVLWSGVFGLFKSQKESIINDLEYFMNNIQSLQQKIAQQAQGQQLMEHCLTAVDMDPSQQHLLYLLEKGNNLVIQGPPGTGKSQTLTGIISNLLANKGTCLVVCEKKTALEVVQQNLIKLGLGELTVIVEDIYRDRQDVVNSVRERAQQKHSNYTTYPSYVKLLQNCLKEIHRLQNFHHSQLQPLLEEHTWADLVNQFLDANEKANKKALEAHLSLESFSFEANELEHILDSFEQAQVLLKPLQTLEQPLNAIHFKHFEATSAASAKLAIQRTLTTALRAIQQAKATISNTQKQYKEQLEEHYYHIYQQKIEKASSIYQHILFLLRQNVEQQLRLVQNAQDLIQEGISTYNKTLEAHFEDLYAQKIKGIDQTATLIKGEIYSAVDEALTTIKEAKEDIMAALYEYERLLEQHFEAVYMQKMDWIDEMVGTIENGLAASPFYFNKNKGFFRAILHGVGAKYKQLEKDKTAVLSRFSALQKLHQKHQYFNFKFLSTKDKKTFTFQALLEQLESYREAVDHWHLQQNSIIQKEVRELNSRYSLKAVPYKEQAQSINQHLSNFRSKILRNKLIPLEFKYRSLRLRDRFDQLEEIESDVQKIKIGIDEFVAKNETNWAANSYEYSAEETPQDITFRTAFEALSQIHAQHNYFEHDFIRLGRPSQLMDYYTILEHLTAYRTKVETWYPTRLPIIKNYQTNFRLKHLYAPLEFEATVETWVQQLAEYAQKYNQEQLLKLPFQKESTLFVEQLEEWKMLETQLEAWQTNFEYVKTSMDQEWSLTLDDNFSTSNTTYTLESLDHQYQQLMQLHQQYNYFDVNFPSSQPLKSLLQQEVLKTIQQYRIWTQQWYLNRTPILNNHIQELSIDTVLNYIPLASTIATIAEDLHQFEVNFNAFQHLETTFSFKNNILSQQKTQLEVLEQQVITLQGAFNNFEAYYPFRLYWQQLSTAQQAAYQALALVQPHDWEASFTSWYLYAFLLKHQNSIPDQQHYTQHKNHLLNYLEELKKLLVAHSLRYWRAQQSQAVARFHQEKAPIKLHSLYNKRGHTGGKRTPLRKIIATDAQLFTRFFPVLLVSPSVCSSILPLEPNLFDVVIFDEASQLRLEDTFCALIRGRYKVISGDSQQMPPSDYFLSNTTLINDDWEEEVSTPILVKESIDFLSHTESLLEYALAEGNYKESFLEVHYRSKHPYLIDFSNAAFYSNRLAPMPNQELYKPIDFFAVNGTYLNYTNPTEAEQIIDYIIQIAQPHRGSSCPSVGIATFNMHQRNLILERIQQRGVQNDKERTQLQKLFTNGLFVKNLENIQGDERDILVISTTFGLREDGSFIQNYGPINRQKGYRLLNVIITRAKQKLAIFTSIPSNYYEQYRSAIQEKGNVGKAVFYAYLAYAKAVHEEDHPSRKAILQLLQEHSPSALFDDSLYWSNDNAFKERVANFLKQHFPNRVLVNYQYAGFTIPLLVKDATGKPTWAFDFDTFHQTASQEAYCWDLFREHHLTEFGFIYHRIWSKDWWDDIQTAKEQLLEWIKSPKA
ncbi:AAA domain-containing protein [Aureispira sp. CCB-QB1]|uniref:AAA domain-containing protein n=1 Tax=Aureispira sp. CCB-QB1 TaxID=1313421 RepID=UPI000696DD44|nr:AAA domain-containing protein [Aureispira sp. CCB-QB1]